MHQQRSQQLEQQRIGATGQQGCQDLAESTPAGARKMSPARFQRMRNIFHLSVESLVFFTSNLCTSADLANGSTGVVKDLVYNGPAESQALLPKKVWVGFVV